MYKQYFVSVKLADRARKQGISYRAAWNQYKAGRLGVPDRQLPSLLMSLIKM
jgi:hypothetical protein